MRIFSFYAPYGNGDGDGDEKILMMKKLRSAMMMVARAAGRKLT